MTQVDVAYAELLRLSRERTLLVSCLELLGWDELTYMPRGGVEHRAQQTAYLAGLYHDLSSAPQLGELLEIVEQAIALSDADSDMAINARRWRWAYSRHARLPRGLVEELARVTTTAQQVWAEAREADDFARFAPWLRRVVELVRSRAECITTTGVLYDAALEDYEPTTSTAQLTELFAALKPELTRLLQAIAGSPVHTSSAILRREFPLDRQRIFAESVVADIGFDFDRGRLDQTTHPFFSAVGPRDCRIATHYCLDDFSEAFFASLHELGHALYEQGLDPQHYGAPLGESSSLGIHESQSRLWENVIGRSRAFWQHFFPRAREVFHDVLHHATLDEFWQAVNHVQPGFNRVRADEASYDLHVLVRFELEQALLSGDLAPEDLPAAWNEKYHEYLGVVPRDDATGCLQDGHWGAGQFGYFPTYTLGNVYAAQIAAQARRDVPDLDRQMSQGNFRELHAWLGRNIYRHGQRFTAPELMERATGQPMSHQALIDALWEKYGQLYKLSK